LAPDEFMKKLPKLFFFKIKTYVNLNMENSPKVGSASLLKKTDKIKQSPNGQKCAQSGHPVCGCQLLLYPTFQLKFFAGKIVLFGL
jgi:hypothetical protein